MPVILGDCLEVMKRMDAGSVDAIVTDPPAGISFMGKKWDHDKGGRDHWIAWMTTVAIECLRVSKPGGHALVWSIPRTSHWTAMAWENAGWEVRDRVDNIFGTGFPKSMDISKAIDKERTEDIAPIREVCRSIRSAMDNKKLKSKDLVQHFDNCHPRLIDHWAARDSDSQPNLPTMEQWEVLKFLLDINDETLDYNVKILNDRKGKYGDSWNTADIIGKYKNDPGGLGGQRFTVIDSTIRAPATDAAKQWNGWGTALKPAHEDWLLFRKPVEGTIAQNVLKHGVGGINIDGCRVEIDPAVDDPHLGGKGDWSSDKMAKNVYEGGYAGERVGSSTLGRFPANLILDDSEEVRALFPNTKSGKPGTMRKCVNESAAYGAESRLPGTPMTGFGDEGSAARFFYCAKASRSERGEDNKHPTVKPLALMRYLCKLITPPGGLILDPFGGSGSTGVAAKQEGFQSILIELEQESYEIANARMRNVK